MKRLITIAALLLCGCSADPAKNMTKDYLLPNELEDCKVFYVETNASRHRNLYIVRCPESYVSTNWTVSNGKTQTQITVGSN